MTKEEAQELLNQEIRCALKHEEGCTGECKKCELYDETKQKDIEEVFYEMTQRLNKIEVFALKRWQCTMDQRDGRCSKDCKNCKYAEENYDDLIENLIKLCAIANSLMD